MIQHNLKGENTVEDYRKIWQGATIALCVALGAALLPLPYGYYTLLKLFATLYGLAWLQNQTRFQFAMLSGWGWGMVAMVVVYNPIVQLHLGRDVWSVVNLATIVFLAAAMRKGLPGQKQ